MLVPPTLESLSTDVLIIGTGPTGLAAAIYTARAGLETIIVGKKEDSRLNGDWTIENYPGILSVNYPSLSEGA
jgi:thioredoxin reductase (NADPH)